MDNVVSKSTNIVVDDTRDVFNLITKDDFKNFVNLAKSLKSDINVDFLYNEYIGGNKCLDTLQERWEKSLVSTDGPDFSVYGEDMYLNESFRCWKNYARRYVQNIKKYCDREDACINKDEIKCVVDLGCGNAFSTIGLADIFKNSIIYGTNVKGTISYKMCEIVTSKIDRCVIIDEAHNDSLPQKPDIVFASEFFEHLTNPINLLNTIICKYKPKYFIFANTFTQMSIGHFNTYYDIKGNAFAGKNISKEFNNSLRKNGYKKVDTGFFNSRPQIFILEDESKVHDLSKEDKEENQIKNNLW
jgi:SAM-dependent methyltransferase